MSTTAPAATHQPHDHGALARTLRGPVLLATDGHGRTDATAIAARLVAEHLGAPIEALAVVRPVWIDAAGLDVPTPSPELEAERRAHVEADVRARLTPVLGAPDRWTLDTRVGLPGHVIAQVARERRVGLVVVGTGGHGATDRLLGEEVALQAMRRASVPVLAVASDLAAPIRRAVVGMDFGAASIRAAAAALALLDPAPDAPGLLTLVHVRSPLEDHVSIPVTWDADYEASIAAMMARVRDLLRPSVRDDVTVETRLRTGVIVDRLIEAAEETGADLVAVGTHGPGWMERLFLGSVATNTLRRAGRTVLVAPVPGAADRVRLELRIAGRVTLAEADDWAGALDTLTRRNLHRRTRLEVSDPSAVGSLVGAEGYRFAGAAYDPHDRRVEIMLGDGSEGAGRRHLTHTVTHVRSVEIVAEDGRRDHALVVEDAHGHTVLTFLA